MRELDPCRVLETLGVDNYRLDYEKKVVLLPLQSYRKAASYFFKSLCSTAFEEGGWRWCVNDEAGYTGEAGSESSPKSAAV